MQIALIFALGPLTSALVNRLGCRLAAIIGGLSCVAGLLLSSLASSIYIIYITYSVLFGFGSSCLYLSSYVITSQYFDKNRSIATGITSSGSGLGGLSVAPMLQALLDTFGWRKTYRITAGIFSVVCVLCLTFDPNVAKRKEERGVDDKNSEGLGMSDEQGVRIMEDRKKWFDLSVFKEKVFVVLTLCNTMASLGHNTPRLHLVRTVMKSIIIFISICGCHRFLMVNAVQGQIQKNWTGRGAKHISIRSSFDDRLFDCKGFKKPTATSQKSELILGNVNVKPSEIVAVFTELLS